MSEYKRWKLYNRKVLVNPFQMRLVAVIVSHFTLVIMIFIGALFAPIIVTLQSGDVTSPHVQQAAREFLVLHTRLWAPLCGAFLLLILHNILITHRIAGPLLRFRRYLKGVGDGDLSSSISFRKKDYLLEDAEIASHMVRTLRDKVSHVQKQFDQATRLWTDLRTGLAGGFADELEQEINTMDELLADCKASLAVFTTEKDQTPSAKSTATSPAEPVEAKV